MALLVPGRDCGEPVVGPEAAGRLAALGVTRLSLLGDSAHTCVFLEGWAFDPATAAEVAAVVFPRAPAAVRIHLEVESVAVSRHLAVPAIAATGEGDGVTPAPISTRRQRQT